MAESINTRPAAGDSAAPKSNSAPSDVPSIGITASQINGGAYSFLVNVAAQVGKIRFASSRTDVDALIRAKGSVQKLVEKHFSNIIYNAETRRQNLARFRDYTFVSLGGDCFVRTVLTRWGMKKTAAMGELSCPFDLAVHPTAAVTELLASDFANYFTGLEFSEELDCVVNPTLNIQFNHDKGRRFAENDYQELRTRYARRMQNFRALMGSEKPIHFIHHTKVSTAALAAEVEQLFRQITTLRANRPTHCIWIHTPPFESNEKFWMGDRGFCQQIIAPYPIKGYIWHRPRHSFSARGHAFERKLAEKLATLL